MSAGIKFFICSSAILALAIVNLSLSPTFNVKINFWNLSNCGKISDELEELKGKNGITQETIEEKEIELKTCWFKKSSYLLEQAVFLINIGIALFCTVFGLLSIENWIKSKVGILGLILGILGFLFTLGYSFLNGLIYINYYNDEIYKIDEEGAFAISNGDNSYKCLFFNKENDKEALYAKFIDLMKSQYNYNKELKDSFDSSEHPEKHQCEVNYNYYSGIRPSNCYKAEIFEGSVPYIDKDGTTKRCEKLYSFTENEDYQNYDKSVRFLTCLIISVLTIICYVGLFITGIMLFKESSS